MKTETKKEINYYSELMTAYGALREYLIVNNIKGEFYTSNGEFLYRTETNVYGVKGTKKGYYLAIYKEWV